MGIRVTGKKIVSRTLDVISLSMFWCALYPALAIAIWRYRKSHNQPIDKLHAK